MRIAVVVCVYPPYRGGIGQAAQRQSELLRELGHEVEVFAPAGEGTRPGTEVLGGLPVHRLRALASYGNSALLPQLARAVRRFDAVYLHYPFFGGAEAAALGAALARVPYVAFFHMDVSGTGARGAFLRAYERTAGPMVLRGARAVMASSDDYFARSSAARHVADVEVVPYGIDTARYSPGQVSGERRAALGLPPETPLIAFVGGMDAPHAFKGVPELLRAFAAAGLAGRAHLALVGDGGLRASYERLAGELGIGAAATFLGRVDEPGLIAVYRAATTTVLPSTTHEEAFGLVLIEGMACGSPAVASALPGVREVVGEGARAGGLLVPPGDVDALAGALARMVDDPSLRDRLATGALARARGRFSREAERERIAGVLARRLRPAVADGYPRGGLSPARRAAALVEAARATDAPAAFVRRELAARARRRPPDAAARDAVGAYRVAGGGQVSLRHGTLDVPLFVDIMVRGDYEPPAAVMAGEDGAAVRLVDLGANIGLFAAFIARRIPVADLVAYEPDATCLDLLRANLSRTPALPAWRVVEACAGTAAGEVAFLGGRFRESRADPGGAGAGTRVPVVDAFPDLLRADWVKIDIEGGEWEILGDPRMRDLTARAIALEYHAWGCPGPDPRALATEALREAGFAVSAAREHAPGYGELWAWRPAPTPG